MPLTSILHLHITSLGKGIATFPLRLHPCRLQLNQKTGAPRWEQTALNEETLLDLARTEPFPAGVAKAHHKRRSISWQPGIYAFTKLTFQ